MLWSAICGPSLGSFCFLLLEEGQMIKSKNVSGNNSYCTTDKIAQLSKASAHNVNIAWYLITFLPALVNQLSGFKKPKRQNDKTNMIKKRKPGRSKLRNIKGQLLYALFHLTVIRHAHNQLIIIHIIHIKASKICASNLWVALMAIGLKTCQVHEEINSISIIFSQKFKWII